MVFLVGFAQLRITLKSDISSLEDQVHEWPQRDCQEVGCFDSSKPAEPHNDVLPPASTYSGTSTPFHLRQIATHHSHIGIQSSRSITKFQLFYEALHRELQYEPCKQIHRVQYNQVDATSNSPPQFSANTNRRTFRSTSSLKRHNKFWDITCKE